MYPSPAELEVYWARLLPDFGDHWLRRFPERWRRCIPICLWGDEGTLNSSSWMVVPWFPSGKNNVSLSFMRHHILRPLGNNVILIRTPDLSIFREDSKCSRYMIYSMLASRYYVQAHQNETLNQLNEILVTDLNQLMEYGVETSSGVPLFSWERVVLVWNRPFVSF